MTMKDEMGNETDITPTENQQKLIDAIRDPDIKVIFCQAPTGAGKTFWSTRALLELLQTGEVERVLYERPMTTIGDHYNPYLKGTLDDKFGPYVEVLESMFAKHIAGGNVQKGHGIIKKLKDQGKLVRYDQLYKAGDNIEYEALLVDEAQNKSREEIFHLITRPGPGGKIILVGDGEYQDYLQQRKSGFMEAMEIFENPEIMKNVEEELKKHGHDFDSSTVATITMGTEDIKRDLHTAFVYASYREYDKEQRKKTKKAPEPNSP